MQNEQTVDVVVIGAGFGGVFAMHKMANEQNLNVLGFDRASGPGGTWYWNRYPGALSDSESYVYQYFFDKELYQDFEFKTNYITQPEILAYIEGVVERFDLAKHFRFNEGITSSRFDDMTQQWVLTTDNGDVVHAKYVINAVGLLAAVNFPDIPGRDSFEGDLVHTAQYPEDLDLQGKRVAVIGTGSTGHQVVTAVGPIADQLGVYVRTPQYSVPVGLREVSAEELAQYHTDFEKTRDKIFNSALGYGIDEVSRSIWDYSEEERNEIFEKAWNEGGGFRFVFSTFGDLASDEEANLIAAEFIQKKIRETIKDPDKAEKVMPKGLHNRRPVCDNGFYATFNYDHVEPINISDTPIDEITPTGIRTNDGIHREYDVIIFATGFDAVDGNYRRMNLTGRNGLDINEAWKDNPTSYMGVTTPGFPNWFMILGPKGPFSNLTTAIEMQVEFISGLIEHARAENIALVEPTAEAEARWDKLSEDAAEGSLYASADSWIFGANIPGKPRSLLFYMGGVAEMNRLFAEEAAAGYPNLITEESSVSQTSERLTVSQ